MILTSKTASEKRKFRISLIILACVLVLAVILILVLTKCGASKPEYMIADSDSRRITEADLADMDEFETWLAVNEIYARHGRMFLDEDIRKWFESKSWYHGTIPGETFDANLDEYMNETEKYNIDFIADYQRKKGWRT